MGILNIDQLDDDVLTGKGKCNGNSKANCFTAHKHASWVQLHIQHTVNGAIKYSVASAEKYQMHSACLTCYLHCSQFHCSIVGVIFGWESQISPSPEE